MFVTIKKLFSPKNKDIRKRILLTLGVLLLFNIGTAISVPGTKGITSSLGFLELMDAMGGGALKKFSIFALGVMPYISASIIISLLQMDIIPYFSELSKQGYNGRRKLNTITRYMGIAFAFLEGIAFAYTFLGKDIGTMEVLRVSVILTGGTAFLLWLGDQITTKGIGNGISLIIMAGIIATIPNMFMDAFSGLVKADALFTGIVSFTMFIIAYLAIIIGVIFIQQSERRIPIQYANQTTSSYGAKQTYMPFKLNSAGVIPVIFASSAISIPGIISGVIKKESFTLFVQKYLSFTSVTGFTLYVLLIVFFAYFYTFLQLKPDELSENLQKQGGYIPGIRPGKETNKYIKMVLSRITVVGAIFLVVIAGLPIIFSSISSLPSTVTIGGTGLLIVVGVVLEAYNQIEASLASRNYRSKR